MPITPAIDVARFLGPKSICTLYLHNVKGGDGWRKLPPHLAFKGSQSELLRPEAILTPHCRGHNCCARKPMLFSFSLSLHEPARFAAFVGSCDIYYRSVYHKRQSTETDCKRTLATPGYVLKHRQRASRQNIELDRLVTAQYRHPRRPWRAALASIARPPLVCHDDRRRFVSALQSQVNSYTSYAIKMSPTTRKAMASDIPEIQRLYIQGDSHHADLLPEVFQPVEGDGRGKDVIQKLIDLDDADYLVAELDGQVIGFVTVQRASHPKYPMFRPHEFALIEDAVVDNPHRGRGVGTILFRAAIDWARNHGLRHVQTTVWHANAGAMEFYLGQGFRPMTMRLELDSEEVRRTIEP